MNDQATTPRPLRPPLGDRLPPTYDLRVFGDGLEPYGLVDVDLPGALEASLHRLPYSASPRLRGTDGGRRGADDTRYRRTPPERYALEFLAFAVMSRQFWPAFAARRHTVLILPDCLRIREKGCARKHTPTGSACTVCHADCLVGRMTEVGRRYGAPAFFSDMDHPKQFKALRRLYPDLSVIGVACVLMLAEGMRAAEAAEIPSQGVLLTYCGCDHWTDDPSPPTLPWSASRPSFGESGRSGGGPMRQRTFWIGALLAASAVDGSIGASSLPRSGDGQAALVGSPAHREWR